MKTIRHNGSDICHLILAAMLLLLASCSTTKKLGENDILYTGVKHLKYHEDSVKVDAGVKDDIFTLSMCAPTILFIRPITARLSLSG